MKKVCFVTGTRAEYGLLQPLMQLFLESTLFELQIVVTGMHLSPEFGLTYSQIESDGFTISDKVELLLSSDTSVGLVKSTGLGLISFPDTFSRLSPDLIIVLGDRYETFSAVIASYFINIPVAHLHGGETTEGAIDEGIRHSISKMAHLHFTSTESHRRRVIQLGENPDSVFNTGAIGIDNIVNMSLLSRADLAQSLKISLENEFFLITYHPVTLSTLSEESQMRELFSALDAFPEINAVFTLPNSDAGGRKIIKLINEYVLNRENAHAYTSLGQLRYLSAVKHSAVVVGNSSSGIIEVPSIHVPTVNIGARQKGRTSAASVLNCEVEQAAITKALSKALSEDFKFFCRSVNNPYGLGDSAQKIFAIIEERIDSITIQKHFFDIEYSI